MLLNLRLSDLTVSEVEFVSLFRDNARVDGDNVLVALRPIPTIMIRSLLTFRERAVRFGVSGLEPKDRSSPDSMIPTVDYLDRVERMYGTDENCVYPYSVRYTRRLAGLCDTDGWQRLPDHLVRFRCLHKQFRDWCAAGCYEPVQPDPVREAIADYVTTALFGAVHHGDPALR